MGKYKKAYSYLANILIEHEVVVNTAGLGWQTAGDLRTGGYDVAAVNLAHPVFPPIDRKVKGLSARIKA